MNLRTRTIPLVGGGSLPVGKILAVGRNYAEHATEMQAPAEPVLFMKPPTALRVPGEEVVLPRDRGSVHHEIEIVVALAGGGTRLTEAHASALPAAYGVGLDLTLRDLQSAAKAKGQPWTLAKGFDGSFPVSTFVAADRIPDPGSLRFHLEVNGVRRQEGRATEMLLRVPALLAFISSWITLEPGDLVLTGTPAGVGPLVPGDQTRLVLEGWTEVEYRFR